MYYKTLRMIIRDVFYELQSRMQEPRRFIQVLAGPRQVGKTTLVEQFAAQSVVPVTSLTTEMADTNDKQWISLQWERVRSQMQVLGQQEHILIIDEIHKINNWSEIIKKEWDADTRNKVNIKLILLGSSRLLLKDGLTESLLGRFELIRVGHWSFAEMQKAFGFTLNQYIYFGGYPGAATFVGNEKRWRKYVNASIVDPAIENDVLMTARIYKPALLRSLFDLGCAYSGELLSYNKIVGQLQDKGSIVTIANYLQVLGEANLLAGIQKFAGDIARQYQSTPKFQVFNNALLSAYQGHGIDNECMDPERWGRWVESAVGAHLLNSAEEDDYSLYYWRERDAEVDFVLRFRDGHTLAIEVKTGRRSDNKGLHIFDDRFHPDKRLIVGKDAMPLDVFFKVMPSELM